MPSLAELLDTSAQWGRGVQNKISDLVSPEAWAQALRNPPRVLSQYQQMQPGQQQQTISEAFDNALNFGPAMLGKIVYHGSPHKFDAFDASKIGTGEGAQAYGHGLYLAENPEVAGQYARNVTGQKIRDSAGFAAASDRNATSSAIDYFKAMKNGSAPRDLDALGKPVSDAHIDGQIKGLTQQLEKEDASFGVKPNLYKVDLPDDQIAKMLDWDKPLSEQTPYVQKIMNEEIKRIGGSASTGERAYKELMFDARMQGNKSASSAMRSNEEAIAASNRLRELGIPGIRYLDQGSRAAPSSAQFAKTDVVGAADDLTALAKSMGLNAEVRHSGSNAGKSSYVSVFDPMTNRYIKSSFRISDHGTGPLRHQEHIHINSPADLATQKNDLFEWVKRNRTEKGVDTTGLSAPSQGTSNYVVFPGNEKLTKILKRN